MPAERRQVVSRITSPANSASVRPSRRRTAALPSAAAATPNSVDLGRGTRASTEFARGLDDAAHLAAGNGNNTTTHHHTHARNLSSSSGSGGTGATTTTTTSPPTHRARPSVSISRASRPQSVYQIVEAYRPLAYSIEKAEQEAKAAAAEKRRSLVPSPLKMMTTTTSTQHVAEDDAMDVDEFGQFTPATATATTIAAAAPVTTPAHEDEDDFAVLRSPTRGKQQEECISGRGMLKRGYHIILDTALEDSEEARWAAIKRMEAQLRELDKSFTRVAPPSRRRIANVTNHHAASAAAPSPSSFSAANRAAWNI